MMKKKIIIHSIVFSPDGVSTAYLYNDIALAFKNNGYEVVVLTTTPHYNVLAEKKAQQPLISKLGGLYFESDFFGIRVIHIPQKKFKSSLLRILGFVYWHFFTFILGLAQQNIDVILSPSPPLTIGVINILIGKLKKAKVIYNVQEIYPDFLVNQGGLKSKIIINILNSIERFVYNRSDAITTIDPIFYKTLTPRLRDLSKLSIIPNFVDINLYKPLTESAGLNSDFFPPADGTLKIMYAGNIGHAQDWEPLVNVAGRIKNLKVEFIVIGEGAMKDYLENEILSKDLNNIRLVPYQPREQMPSIVAYADLHFIFMSSQLENDGFPSKVYTIMACAKPLLVVSGNDTPISNFLKPNNCSFVINSKTMADKCDKIIESITIAMEDRQMLNEMGNRGFNLIEKFYSKNVVTQQYVDLANKLIKD